MPALRLLVNPSGRSQEARPVKARCARQFPIEHVAYHDRVVGKLEGVSQVRWEDKATKREGHCLFVFVWSVGKVLNGYFILYVYLAWESIALNNFLLPTYDFHNDRCGLP